MTDSAKPKKSTLTDAEIKTGRGIGRRSFLLGTLGGTTALAGCVTTGITDADAGPYADAAGMGRGGGYRASGITDSDVGPGSDPVGNGRGRRRACTDSDGGPYADRAGQGRRC